MWFKKKVEPTPEIDPWTNNYLKIQEIMKNISVEVLYMADGDTKYSISYGGNSRFYDPEFDYIKYKQEKSSHHFYTHNYNSKEDMFIDLKRVILCELRETTIKMVPLSSIAFQENYEDLKLEKENRKKFVEGMVHELCCSKLGADQYVEALKEESDAV